MKNRESKLMSAGDLADYMGISRNAAYTLLHRDDFPSIRIGSLLYAITDQVDTWLKQQAEKGGYHFGKETRER